MAPRQTPYSLAGGTADEPSLLVLVQACDPYAVEQFEQVRARVGREQHRKRLVLDVPAVVEKLADGEPYVMARRKLSSWMRHGLLTMSVRSLVVG